MSSGGPLLGLKSGGKCFPGSAIVQTPAGTIPISKLRIGDQVLPHTSWYSLPIGRLCDLADSSLLLFLFLLRQLNLAGDNGQIHKFEFFRQKGTSLERAVAAIVRPARCLE